jgi:hypothetical protein
MGMQYLKVQTDMLVDGNSAVTQEVDKLQLAVKSAHEHFLKSAQVKEQLRNSYMQELNLCEQFEETNQAMVLQI